MKVICEFEFEFGMGDLNQTINYLEIIKKEHVEVSGCSDPDNCVELKSINYLLLKFKELRDTAGRLEEDIDNLVVE